MAIRAIEDGGKPAVTFYEVIERFRGYALIRCKPRTGRTHQIRVHLYHIGHPIVADKAYSGRDSLILKDLLEAVADAPPSAGDFNAEAVLIDRQALHAQALRFNHPITGQEIKLTAPLPADMERTLDALREYRAIGRQAR
jgi:23S rRNA pseudouridine1911/1915/1917 synthase